MKHSSIGIALLLMLASAHASAAPNLVVNIAPNGGTSSTVAAPDFAEWKLTLYNNGANAATDTASNVVLTHAFGADALYDVTVACTPNGGVAAPGAITIADGYSAGLVTIPLASLPVGGLGPSEARLDCIVRGVVRGYPRGAIVHTVNATGQDSGGAALPAVSAQTTSTLVAAEVTSLVDKQILDPVPAGGFAWGTPITYRVTYTNNGTRPMPRVYFRDQHQALYNNTQLYRYQGFGTVTSASTVTACSLNGAPPAGIAQGACPFTVGSTYGGPNLGAPLPNIYWDDDVLYPGQSVVVEYQETYTTPPACTVDPLPGLPNQAGLNYDMYFRPANPDVPNAGGKLFPLDSGNPQGLTVRAPMQDVPRCTTADLNLTIDKQRLSPDTITDLQVGTTVQYRLTVQNDSAHDYVPVHLQLADIGVSWTNRGPVTLQGQVVNCTATGGATCPWTTYPTITGSYTTSTGNANAWQTLMPYPAGDLVVPTGGRVVVDYDVVATNVAACADTWLSNLIRVMPVQPAMAPGQNLISDESGNFYDLFRIVGNYGGPLNVSRGDDTGDPRVQYIGFGPTPPPTPGLTSVQMSAPPGGVCALPGDPTIAGTLGVPPVAGGSVGYDLTVTNSAGSPPLTNIDLLADLTNAGIDLTAPGVNSLVVTCQSVTAGTFCPGGTSPGDTICSGAACLSGSNLALLIDSLPQDGSFTLRIFGPFTGQQGQSFSLSASIAAAANANYTDTNTANNQTTVNAGVGAPATLTISKVVQGTGYTVGDLFTIEVNCGGSVIGSVTIPDGGSDTVLVPGSTLCTLAETARAALPSEWVWVVPETYTSTSPYFTAPATVSIPSGEAADVVVTNTTRRGQATLTVSKTITGAPAGYVPAGPFPIAVNCPGPQTINLQVADNGNASATVNTGTCTVVEDTSALPAPPAGYTWGTPVYTPAASIDLVDGDTPLVAVTNPLVRIGTDLTITKTVSGGPAAGVTGTFAFSADCGADGSFSGNVALANQTTNSGTITGIPANAQCVVSESLPLPSAPAGYAWGATPAPVSLTISATGPNQAAFVNPLQAQPLGTIVVTKQVVGGPAPGGTFGMTVACTAQPFTNTVAVAAGASVTVSNIPTPNTCTVTESAGLPSAPANYAWDTATTPPPPATLTLNAGGSATATIVNTLQRGAATLAIAKQVTGGPAGGITGSFGFTADCGADGTFAASAALAGASSGNTSIAGIPAGATCSVAESSISTAPQGYRWSSTPAPQQVVVGATGAAVAFVNVLAVDGGGGPGPVARAVPVDARWMLAMLTLLLAAGAMLALPRRLR